MIEYLRKVFDESITCEDYVLDKYPGYIRYNYTGKIISWNEQKCVVITPKNDSIPLQSLKKQLMKVQEKCDYPCAISLVPLTASQRSNLIGDRIPFVAAPNQVYFPFWGCVFSERYNVKHNLSEKMPAMTQLIFLFIYYKMNDENSKVLQVDISNEINIPKSSCSRAIKELKEYGLLKEKAEGRKKWLSFEGSKTDVINRAMQYMQSPVAKIIYIKEAPKELSYMIGGIKALSHQTMLAENKFDGSLVFSKSKARKISGSEIIDKQDYLDFGGVQAEVWKYDPALLAEGEYVDDISLVLCLRDDPDERIQKGLDVIRKRNGIREDR